MLAAPPNKRSVCGGSIAVPFGVALAALLAVMMPRAAIADSCDDAKAAVDDIASFNQCINTCLSAKASDISDGVQCLPAGCKITLTMSPQSAQAACSLGECQLPRVLLTCPSKDPQKTPIRPSFLFCPVDSKGDGNFGIDRIEIGQDQTRNGGSPMFMADIPIAPGKDFDGKDFEDILNTGNAKGCNGMCHESKGDANIKDENNNDVETQLSSVLPPEGKLNEELAPYVIFTQDPTLAADLVKKVKGLKKQRKAQLKKGGEVEISPIPYIGSDGNTLVKQNLEDICTCIRNNAATIQTEATTANNDGKTAMFPAKDQNGKTNPARNSDDEPADPNFDVSVLQNLCDALAAYEAESSCAPSDESSMCLNADAEGKYHASTSTSGPVSALDVVLSGNATPTTAQNVTTYTFNSFDGTAQAFDYRTHTLVQMTFDTLTASQNAATGEVDITGIGPATVATGTAGFANPVSDTVTFKASSVGGVITYSITDMGGARTLMHGIGEPGLSSLGLPGAP